jgi:hypothetical protein
MKSRLPQMLRDSPLPCEGEGLGEGASLVIAC